MPEPSAPPPDSSIRDPAIRGPGRPGVTAIEVFREADACLRAGQRPTVALLRARLGRGSPNTVNPLLDQWWQSLGRRLDAGPAALHRLPESVLHVVEALWLQLLEDARRRARGEHDRERTALDDEKRAFEVRSHVLTLREGELAERLRDRERTLQQLETQLRELTTLIRKEQATRQALESRLAARDAELTAVLTRQRLPRRIRTVRPGPEPRHRLPKRAPAKRARRPRAAKSSRRRR